MRDESIKVVSLVDPITASAGAEVNGDGVDTNGFDEGLLVVSAGAFTATGVVGFTIQESDDDTTYTDISGASITSLTTANDSTTYVGRLNLKNLGRYIRLQYDVDTDDVTFGATLAMHAAKREPVSQVNTVMFDV